MSPTLSYRGSTGIAATFSLYEDSPVTLVLRKASPSGVRWLRIKAERVSRFFWCGISSVVRNLSSVLGSPSLVAIRLPVVAPRLPSVSLSPACNSASDRGPVLRVRGVPNLLPSLLLWEG